MFKLQNLVAAAALARLTLSSQNTSNVSGTLSGLLIRTKLFVNIAHAQVRDSRNSHFSCIANHRLTPPRADNITEK